MRPLTRRRFLRGAGGALVPLPLLPSLLSRPARAETPAPRRVLWWFNPNGMNADTWTPEGTGSTYTLSETLSGFATWRDRMTVISGLRIEGCQDGAVDGHNGAGATYLTGVNLNPDSVGVAASVDQRLADRWSGETAFRSLELGMEAGVSSSSGTTGAYRTNISWAGPQTPRPKVIDPGALFHRLFGSTSTSLTPEEQARRTDVRTSVLDGVLDDLHRLEGQLPVSDRRKLDEYATAIHELETRIAASSTLTCEPGDAPTSLDDFPDRLEQMCDLMALAFQCDLTRIITFMLGNEGTNQPHPWIGVAEAHHGLSHHAYDPAVLAQLSLIDQWQAGVFAGLLSRLDAIPDPLDPSAGSLLDTTVLLYGGGMADGHYHTNEDLPLALFGGTQAFTHGQHVVADGAPLADLHLAVCAAVGEDLGTLGIAGTGPMSGLT